MTSGSPTLWLHTTDRPYYCKGLVGGAANTEKRKKLHYKDLDRTKYIYCPFILETGGAFGQPALKLCSKLRKIWMTKCCNGNHSPNFSKGLASSPTWESTDPVLVSISTMLQSHNGQMILERSPRSSKLLNSVIDHSLARDRSQKIWATKKLRNLQQPVVLQRIFGTKTTAPDPTVAEKEQSADSGYTYYPLLPITRTTQNLGTLSYRAWNTLNDAANPQDSTLRNCKPDTTVAKGCPVTRSSTMERYEHTDTDINTKQRTNQNQSTEPSINSKHKLCMNPKLKSTTNPTNYISEQKASCETPTKATISTMN